MNRPLLWILIALVAALVLTFFRAPLAAVLAFPILVGLLPLVYKKAPLSFALTAILFYGVGIILATQSLTAPNPLEGLTGEGVEVVGVVDTIPQDKENKTTFTLSLIKARGEGVDARVLVSMANTNGHQLPALVPGEVVTLNGEISLPQGSRNPGGFDNAMYLKANHVDGTMYLARGTTVESLGKKTGIRYAVDRVRMALIHTCNTTLSQGEAAVVRGVLLGDKAISPDIKATFRDAGLAHVMAVSGLHVGYLYALVIYVGEALGLKKKYQLGLLIPCLAFYVALTGFSPSVIRAAIMVGTLCLGAATREHYDALNGLCLAAIILLLLEPALLWAVGFQLSFGAVLAIVLFYKPMVYHWVGGGGKKPVVEGLCLTLCATLGTLPFTLYHFHRLPLVSIISNVVVVPLVGILLVAALILVPAMTVVPALSALGTPILGSLSEVVLWLSEGFASIPGLSILGRGLNAVEMMALFLGALLVTGYFNLRHRMQRVLICTALPALCVGAMAVALLPRPLTITYLDVGQGDCALVETPKGGAYLIDGGGYQNTWGDQETTRPSISERVLLPALYHKGITHLDGAFITHNHADHAQGIEELLTKIPVDHLYLSTKYNKEALLEQDTLPVSVLSAGAILSTADGLRVEVLWPDAPREALPDDEQNEASMVLRLVYGERSFLFMGDAGKPTEDSLGLVDSDLLKIGHHGSDTATGPDFLRRVSPEAAVISVGAYNTFGHPTQGVLDTLKNQGVPCLRTDKNGAIQVQTRGKDLVIKTYLNDEK